MKIHLFQFSDGNPDNTIYLVSTISDEAYLRGAMDANDHGGMVYEDFEKVWQTGTLTEITSKSQIPDQDLDIIPFTTNERVEGKYMWFDDMISSLFP